MNLLVANRGEVAIRVMRAAAELGVRTTAVFSEDDDRSLHTRRADAARPLRGAGARAYLDAEQILALAIEEGCDAIHPGYGFLSENAAFARRCAEAGITFVGPRPETLELCGDKGRTRALAERCGVPILPGTSGPTRLDEAREFFDSLGGGAAIMVKALAGGGGRGMRAVHHPDELDEAFERCRSEAEAAFGNGDVYVERLIPRARHIEVQIVGDGTGEVCHLWERECTLQRRHQKLIEVAPSPGLPAGLRDRLTAAAVRMAEEVRYQSLGTFEFLTGVATKEQESAGEEKAFAFNEVNPRLQVEHTVTEEVMGIDLVKQQLLLAAGRTLADLGLQQAEVTAPRGFALEVRINMETMGSDGEVRPSGGTLTAFEPPSGPGIRSDSYGYVGYATNPRFDSLLAKLVCSSSSAGFADVVARTYRALCEFKIEGVSTNLGFLQNLLGHPDVAADRVDTRFIDDHIAELATPSPSHRRLYFEEPAAQPPTPGLAGAKIDDVDPLAVLKLGKTPAGQAAAPGAAETGPTTTDPLAPTMEGPPGTVAIRATMQGTIVSIDVREGDLVREGQQLLVMDAMKMEHVITAATGGLVLQIAVSVGDAVYEGHPLVFIEEAEVGDLAARETSKVEMDAIRPDLAEVQERHAFGFDAARPEAVAKRRKTGHRTARENVDDLCDPGAFVEYAPLVVAGQRRRRSEEDLIENTPADGLIAGIGGINGELFGEERSRCVIMSYDYTVLAGTQGMWNHFKKDRTVRARREMAPSPGVLYGGRRRAARRHRRTHCRGPQCAGLQLLRQAQRPGAPGRDHHGPLLCRQRGPARLLRRHHCHRGLQHRRGRSGHDRGRRPRGLPPRGGGTDVRPGAERRGRHSGGRRGRGGAGGEEVPVLLPGSGRELGVRRPANPARSGAGEPAAHLRHPEGHRDHGRRGLGAGDPPPLGPRDGDLLDPGRGTAGRA